MEVADLVRLLSLSSEMVRVYTILEWSLENGKEDKFMRYSEGMIIMILHQTKKWR